MRFGTWNLRSLYRSGSFMTVARELARYILDLVGVQEVRWDKGGTVRAGECTDFYGKGNECHQVFFVNKRIVSAIKRVEIASDRISYMVKRGCWCNSMVLNAHAPTEEKRVYSKDSFNDELKQVFDHIPKYKMKILLGDFNANLGRRILSNRRSGMKVYMRIVMTMVLE
jgi:hypothetical protein